MTTKHVFSGKRRLLGGVMAGLLSVAAGTAHAANLTIAQSPLFLSVDAEPNIMFIIDNSGSMGWDYMPDNAYFWDWRHDSSAYNKIYYDPTVTYQPWSYSDGTLYPDSTVNPNGGYYYYLADGTKVTITDATEKQNFRNWYSYYRTRMDLAKAGVGAAFAQLGTNVRVGFGRLNDASGTVDGINNNSVIMGVRKFEGSDRTSFFSTLYSQTTTDRTPLRRALDDAGKYFQRTDSRGPWDTTPGDTSDDPEALACRQSYTILMSDGYWNDDEASTSGARENVDGSDGPEILTPTNYQYTPKSPFMDTHSDTLADVAMYYWNRDLRDDLDNKVPTNSEDPAFWQHMVTFTIGLGVTGTIDPDTAFDAIGKEATTTITWPSPTSSDAAKIDDMLHAAVNGRGGFFSATNPTEFANALTATLENIAGRTGSAAAVATNSTRISSDTLIYQGRFNSGNWTGQLLAYPINPDGSIGDVEWDASTLLPSEANRNIFTLNDSTNAGVAFAWAGLSDQQKADLGYDAAADATNGNTATEDLTKLKISYLRGDSSEEGNQGGPFRNRASLLGDLVNSDPFFVQHANYGYNTLTGNSGTEGVDYLTFRNSSAYLARPPMVYVGVNDGMLHAFNADTTTNSNEAGVEQFAYVPDGVIPNLSALTDPGYTHQFYVDGSPKAGDAYLPTTGTCPLNVTYSGTGYCWKTVLLGSLGAGGKSVFALDVTDPDNFSASNVMWEFTDSELGVTIGQPTIVRLTASSGSTNWYAIFGNGYNSTSQKAQLFVVNLATGALVKRIDTGVGSVSVPNGLSTPIPVDINGDRVTDYVYAGDLYGNMWKFDFTGTSTNNWDVAYKSGSTPIPFFESCTTSSCSSGELQSITVRPTVGRHPDGGIMVYWGTGKYFETGDDIVPDNPQVQTVYGVRDQGTAITTSRATLQEQTIDYQVTGGSVDYRIVSTTPTSYASYNGWYLDLVPPSGTADGERVISTPVLRHDRLIFTSAIPSADACDFGGSGWLMELDAINGTNLTYAVMDVNGDSTFDFYTLDDGTTVPITGKRLDGLGEPGAIITAGDVEYKYISTSSGTINVTLEQGGGSGFGRQSWHQIR